MNEFEIMTKNGSHYIDSRNVAEMVEKDHKNLLRDIRGYINIMEKGGRLKVEPSDFFVESTYKNAQNKDMPCYLISKLGAEMIANKLIGEKGVLFTAFYVQKFNAMEKRERTARNAELADTCMKAQEISARILSAVFDAAYVPEKQRKESLNLIYQQSGVLLPVKSPNVRQTYPVSEITRQLGILSLSGRPHVAAVSAIISMIYIGDEHKIVVNYKHNTLIGYDEYVTNSIKDWLKQNEYPCKIPCGTKTYNVKYSFKE